MKTKLKMVGDEVGLAIPPEMLRELGLQEGDAVEIEAADRGFQIKQKGHVVEQPKPGLIE